MTSRSVKWLEWKWAYTLTIHKKKRIYTKIWFTLRRSKYCHHSIRKFCERGGKGFKSCLRKLQVAWSEIKGSHSVCPAILSLWFRDFLYPTPWYPGAHTNPLNMNFALRKHGHDVLISSFTWGSMRRWLFPWSNCTVLIEVFPDLKWMLSRSSKNLMVLIKCSGTRLRFSEQNFFHTPYHLIHDHIAIVTFNQKRNEGKNVPWQAITTWKHSNISP